MGKQLMRRFTTDLDNTVQKSTFLNDYNELYSRTAQSVSVDSSQVLKCLQPVCTNNRRAAPSKAASSGHKSRVAMLATRKRDDKRFAIRQEDRRMTNHIRRRN